MHALTTGLLALLMAVPVPAQSRDPDAAAREFGRALEAYSKKDYDGYRQGVERWLAVVPDSAHALFDLAAANALAGDRAKAVELLAQVIDRRLGFDPRNDRRFASLADDPGYRNVLARREALEPKVLRATVAATIGEPDLIPEGIEVDPATGRIFVGSLAKEKIVVVDAKGEARDFVKPGEGLWDILGMKADPARRTLWVCTAAGEQGGRDSGKAALLGFDLGGGRLKYRYEVSADRVHLFNDLAIARNGDVYLTDSEAGAVYRLASGAKALELFLPYGSLFYPNGIAIAPDGARLVVASASRGVSTVDLKTKAIRDIATGPTATLAGIDGLYVYGGDLVAVQNGIGEGRVMRFKMNPAFDRVVDSEVLESRNERFDIPTTGSIAGEDFYFIANSHLQHLGAGDAIADRSKLRDVVILRVALGAPGSR